MAVYTEVSFEDLERLLQDYDIGTPLAFKGIAEGVENSNFYLQTDRGASSSRFMKNVSAPATCLSIWA
jgi:homoserine kinase type II